MRATIIAKIEVGDSGYGWYLELVSILPGTDIVGARTAKNCGTEEIFCELEHGNHTFFYLDYFFCNKIVLFLVQGSQALTLMVLVTGPGIFVHSTSTVVCCTFNLPLSSKYGRENQIEKYILIVLSLCNS